MQKTVSLIIAGIILFTLSCDEQMPEKTENYTIEFGTMCGWCAGTEFIKITSSKIEYERVIPCGPDKGNTSKERKLTDNEWNILTKSFDNDKYIKLQYNECHTCYDGCDELIRVTTKDSTHQLRYLPSKTIIEIDEFQKKLEGLMEEMKKR